MATARVPQSNLEENRDVLVKDNLPKVRNEGNAQAAKRRALGDIGNLVGPFNTSCQVGKDKDAVATKLRSSKANGDAAEDAAVAAPIRPSALVPSNVRTRSQTRLQQQGVSLSTLLQTRSEAAVKPRKAVEAPPSPLPDIDGADRSNPLAATEYVNDIYTYYRRVEPKYRVSPSYMASQTDVNEKMRAILVDWLVEVHLKFKLMPETLYMTCNLIDRFLEAKPVSRKNLQLVGVTAMLIASKYEEIWAPEVRDFVYISDKAYSRQQILAMEKQMLNTLHFNLTVPTPYNFLARFLKAANSHFDKEVSLLASYLVELSMVEYSMLKYSYSLTSAAALYVSLKTLKKHNPYPRALAKHSTYSLEAIRPCAVDLVKLMQKAHSNVDKPANQQTLTAVHKKYSSAKFLEIAKVLPLGDVSLEPEEAL